MNEQVKEIVTKLTTQRENLDSIKTAINDLPKSRGTALAYTALEKSRMYIGEICRELGKEYPYEATKTATTAEGIQEAIDKSTIVWKIQGNEIVDLNKLRENLETELTTLLNTITLIKLNNNEQDRFVMNCITSEAYRGLKESRMYLGIRLGEIRDNANILNNSK